MQLAACAEQLHRDWLFLAVLRVEILRATANLSATILVTPSRQQTLCVGIHSLPQNQTSLQSGTDPATSDVEERLEPKTMHSLCASAKAFDAASLRMNAAVSDTDFTCSLATGRAGGGFRRALALRGLINKRAREHTSIIVS